MKHQHNTTNPGGWALSLRYRDNSNIVTGTLGRCGFLSGGDG